MREAEAPYRGSRFLMVAAALVIVVAGLRAIKAIALPFIIAVFLSVLSAPLVAWLQRRRVPRVLSVLAAVLTNIAVAVAIVFAVGGSIRAFTESLPEYQQRLEGEVRQGLEWLENKGFALDTAELVWLRELLKEIEEESPEIALSEVSGPAPAGPQGTATETSPVDPGNGAPPNGEPRDGSPNLIDIRAIVDVVLDGFLALVGTTLRGLADLLTMTFLIFIMMVFILFEAGGLPGKLQRAFGWQRENLARMTEARREIQRYLVIKTLVSLTTGVSVGLWVWLIGLDFPELWGLIAFFLNYIPSIGSFIAAVPAVFLALIDMGVGGALLVALGYAVVNLILGNFVEPHLLGRRLGISTLVVFLSLVFWGWVWGPIGMLLSVLLTMVLKIVMEHTEDFRWLAQLIGNNPLPERK